MYLNWIGFGAFSPILRPHCTNIVARFREPWLYDEETLAVARAYFKLRYRLLPVFYAAAHASYLTGEPVCKRLGWNYPRDREALACRTQFMLGKDLLVAPVFGALPMPVKAENYLSSVEATFYAGRSPKGDPLARTHYKTLARSLDHTSPLEPVPVYDFCARFETDVRFAEDTQLFARLDDGATVYVDGKCVFTDNTLHSAQLFAHHPGVIGWQIDNEIFTYSGGCYCENCKNAFRGYLKTKFKTIDALNEAWGMARWSLTYDGFEDIQPPYPRQWRHPSLIKAWHDFQCAQIKSYVDEQADVLHAFGCTNVGTDMMANNALSYDAVNEKLDVVQFNHYNPAKDLPTTAFSYDFLRCVKDKPFWVVETQANWNGSEYADCGYRPTGACYVNTWLPVARGAEMNLYWLFRTHPNGHEMGHGALYSAAGRAYRTTAEIARAAKEFAGCDIFLRNSCIFSEIALHYSGTAVNLFDAAPLIKDFSYRDTLVRRYHAAFRHHNIDVIDTAHSLKGYKVVISPFLACADENGFQERIMEWVKAGGTWIVGPMSDIMDGNVRKYTDAPYSFLEEAAGVYTQAQEPVANDVFTASWTDGTPCSVGTCYDAYVCRPGTKSLAVYDKGELSGLSAIAERTVGKGKIVLVGNVLSAADLLRIVGLPPIAEASGNVMLVERSGKEKGIIAVETENTEGYVVLKERYADLLRAILCPGALR